MSAFEQLHPAIRYHIVNTLGWDDLRPTQMEAIAPIHAGEDVLLFCADSRRKDRGGVLAACSHARQPKAGPVCRFSICVR